MEQLTHIREMEQLPEDFLQKKTDRNISYAVSRKSVFAPSFPMRFEIVNTVSSQLEWTDIIQSLTGNYPIKPT
jgi:hypothetical protein